MTARVVLLDLATKILPPNMCRLGAITWNGWESGIFDRLHIALEHGACSHLGQRAIANLIDCR